jgi:hypothetical protein
MKVKARKRVMLFIIRSSFTIVSIINPTNVSPSDRALLILDHKDLNLTENDITWTASDMKKDVANMCEQLEVLNSAVRIWCLQVRQKGCSGMAK